MKFLILMSFLLSGFANATSFTCNAAEVFKSDMPGDSIEWHASESSGAGNFENGIVIDGIFKDEIDDIKFSSLIVDILNEQSIPVYSYQLVTASPEPGYLGFTVEVEPTKAHTMVFYFHYVEGGRCPDKVFTYKAVYKHITSKGSG